MTHSPPLPGRIRALVGADAPAELDGLGRSGAQVLRLGNAFLKIAAQGTLERAAQAQTYFHQKGLAAPLLAFEQESGRDWLLVESVGGLNACSPALLAQPESLARRLGETARALHETDPSDCPLSDANPLMLRAYEREHGAPFPGDTSALKRDALIHGDFCLPNLFFGDAGLAGLIDLGDAGPGDRHFDLYWAMWSLAYNLKTDRFHSLFLDAYGRDAFDEARYALCAAISESV